MLGLGISLTKGVVKALTYVKDNLKLFFNFKSTDRSLFLAGNTSFDGSDDYISTSEIDLGLNATYSFWFNNIDVDDDGAVVGVSDWTNGSNNISYCIYFEESAIFFRVDDDYVTFSNHTSIENQWDHFAFVREGTSVKMYVNGVLKETETGSGDFSSINSKIDTIGGTTTGSTSYKECKLSNMGVWSRALSVAEIQGVMWKNYADLSTIDKSSLVSWWALDSTTTGSELITGAVNGTEYPFDSFTDTFSTNRGFTVETDGSGTEGCATNLVIASPNTAVSYQFSYTAVINSGGAGDTPRWYWGSSQGGASAEGGVISTPSAGSNTVTITPANTNSKYLQLYRRSASNVTFSNLSLKEVAIVEDSKGSNNGSIVGATTNTSAYGGNSPFLPRIVDQADPKDAVQLSTGSTSFDGSSDYIDCGSDASLRVSGDFTISCWFNTSTSQGAYIFARDTGSDPTRSFYLQQNASSNRLQLRVDSGSADQHVRGTTDIADGNWHHVSGVFDAGSTLKIYLDGALETVSDGSADASGVSSLNTTASNPLIGTNKTGGDFWEGKLANVSLHSRALSQSEIQSIMFKSYSDLTSAESTNLVSWYDLGTQTNNLVQPATGETLGSNTFVSLNNFSPKIADREIVSVSGDELTLTIPTANDAGMSAGNLANLGFSTALGYAVNDLAKFQFEAKIATNGSGSGQTLRIFDSGSKVIPTTDISLTSEYQTFTIYCSITSLSYSIPYFLRMGSRTGTDIYKFKNFNVQKVTSNTGVVTGATTTTSYNASPKGVADPVNYGKVYSGRAFNFDGTNDKIDIDDSTVANCISGSAGAVSWWAKPDDLTASGEMFSSYNTGGSTERFKAGMYVVSSVPYIRVAYEGSAGAYTVSEHGSDYGTDVGLTTGWHHFCYVIESNSSRKLYVDGVLKHTETTSYTADTSYTDFAIGCYRQSSSTINAFFDGKISNLCTFNTSLTLAQVQELYTNPEMQLPTGVSASNLKGAWMLNEGAGSTAYDGSGNGNNGTIDGATFVTGESDIAQTALMRGNEKMLFDGSDDYISLGSTISASSTSGAMTVSCWVMIDEIDSTYRMIIGGTHPNLFAYCGYYGNNFKWLVDGAWNTSNTVISANTLYHLVYWKDNTSYKFYVNGAEDWSITDAGVLADITTFGDSPNYEELKGFMDEIAVWDEALTASEITALYNSGVPIDALTNSGNYASSANLTGYWRNSGATTWADLKGSNNGTVNGSPATYLLTEGLTSGKDSVGFPLADETAIANGIRFYGDGYIPTPDSPAIQLGSADFTIDAWIKPNLGVGDSLKQILYIKGVATPHTGVDFHFDDSADRLRTTFDDGDETVEFNGVTNAITGVWQHVALVVDRTAGEAKHYVNGVQSGSTKDISALESSFTSDASYDPSMGAKLLSGTLYQKYEGLIDEVRLYNKALSADELLKNYNHGKGKHS